MPDGEIAARKFLETAPDAIERLERVSNLINGFETPYGMELLATVHWVVMENRQAADNSENAIALVHEWNTRKRDLFKPQHIHKAWQRLHQQNWFFSAITTNN